ncbi:MAG: hypothetical protein LC803_23735 [Acidobacteria bacterium]|nr:hypothetical protein [Acidobacteriota bacterium]
MIYWNVQHFSEDKFWVRARKRKRDEEEDWGGNDAQNYLNVLFNAITANAPDIIVIIEARPAGNTGGGTLLSDDGSMRLLRYLRNNNNPLWALVPPVISGAGNAGEGIGVYYLRTPTFFFTGPWRWPGGAGPAAPGIAAALYPIQYRYAFSQPINNRVVPGGSLYNGGQVERRLAGQWRYFAGGGGGGGGAVPITFGGPGTRSPFNTTFYDSAAGQDYSILAFHGAPGQNLANPAVAASTLAMQTAGNLFEVQNIGPNETIVVVGDFNVSLFEAAATAVAYAPFAANYVQVVDTLGGAALPAGYPARGYLSTHMVEVHNATPSNTDGYPAFGYMSQRDLHGQYDSIDNAFVWNGAVANETIANLVTGAPYAAPPANIPPGALAYASALGNPASLNSPFGYNPAGMTFDDEVDLFRDIDNYARVFGVSDHMPLVFDF